jgi:hypothetical protein
MRFLFLALVACAPSSAPRSEMVDVYSSGESPRFVLTDVEGDGTKDLVTSFGGSDPGVTIRRGSITGTFGDAQRVLVGDVTWAVHGTDFVVGDGQHIGLLPNGHGPFRVLAACRDAVLGANDDGVLTTNGRDLVLHSWDLAIAKPLEIAPLVPVAMTDIDGDGRSDIVGTALGHAAIRRATLDGFGPVHLLGEMDGMAIADADGDGHPDVVTWREGRAFAWNARGTPVAAFTLPPSVTSLAAGDLDGDGKPEIVFATRDRVEILGGAELDHLWRNVRQLAIDRGRIFVADDGFIAVVRPPKVKSSW